MTATNFVACFWYQSPTKLLTKCGGASRLSCQKYSRRYYNSAAVSSNAILRPNFQHQALRTPTPLLLPWRRSFIKPPPINLTKHQGPDQAVDPDLHERSNSISFVGEDKEDKRIYVHKFNSMGFRLSNGMFAVGPIVIFPHFVLQWKVGRVDTWTMDCFTPFFLVEPRVDVLLIGYGDAEEKVPLKLRQELMQAKRFGLDFMPTDKAVGVFNFMAEESRYCAGLFIPPSRMTFTDDDIFQGANEGLDIRAQLTDLTNQKDPFR